MSYREMSPGEIARRQVLIDCCARLTRAAQRWQDRYYEDVRKVNDSEALTSKALRLGLEECETLRAEQGLQK